MTNQELWQTVLAQVQLNISQANFATWFKNTEISCQKEGRAIVSVPNLFVKEWLENKYNKPILKILHGLNEEIKDIEYVVGKIGLKTVKRPAFTLPEETNQLEFLELKVNRETNLNPRYTFDSFVVGPFNELPHAAAIAVSKNPGSVYNPLFIYGGVGLGKTHLLQAMGNEIVKNFAKKKVKYLSTEKFASEVVSAIKNHEMESLKVKYRAMDVLIIDDVQFLAGKEKTQEEFFHFFNVLYEANKQIILSSDRPPKAIQSLAERLRSRFEGGMIADIGMPDFETRVAILKTKAQTKGADFSEDVYEFIANSIQRNIRELEGALNRLIIYQKINGQQPDIETVKNLLKTCFLLPLNWLLPKKLSKLWLNFMT
jgi:chromosomal replication initiator protein